jgi:hypothetical protein
MALDHGALRIGWQRVARRQELHAAPGAGEHRLHHGAGGRSQHRGARIVEREGLGRRDTGRATDLDEGQLVVQREQRPVRHRRKTHARRQAAAQQRGVQDLLAHRQDQGCALCDRERGELAEIRLAVLHRRSDRDAARHGARRTREMTLERLGDDHTAARAVQRTGDLQRFRQTPERQQHRGPVHAIIPDRQALMRPSGVARDTSAAAPDGW